MPEAFASDLRDAILSAADAGVRDVAEWETVLGIIARDEDQLGRLRGALASDDSPTTWTTTILTTTTIDCTMTTTTTTFTKLCGEGFDPGEIAERGRQS